MCTWQIDDQATPNEVDLATDVNHAHAMSTPVLLPNNDSANESRDHPHYVNKAVNHAYEWVSLCIISK